MHRGILSCALVALAGARAAGVLVTFTGGTVTHLDATTAITNNAASYDSVDYYTEQGYRMDFLPNSGSAGFATHVGDYYGVGNDVIHTHWATGHFGGVTTVEITQLAPGTFDLNYFTLTSNTEHGGGQASGLEQAWVQGYYLGNPTGPAVLLPSEDWGFPATQIALGPDFNAVDRVVFFVTDPVDCFGMDDFYINEVPAPAGLAVAAGAGALVLRRRR